MILFNDLYEAYLICRKYNRRSEDLVRFELNLYQRLYRLLQQVNNHTYHSEYSYSFIHKRSKSREIFAAEVEFKTLQVYVDIRLRPIVESKLTDRTFNNRKGKGSWGAIKQVIEDIKTVSCNYTKNCYIIKSDFQGFFPNIDLKVAWLKTQELLAEYEGIDKEEVEYICKFTCFFNPQFKSYKKGDPSHWKEIADYKSLFKKPFGTGAVIGFIWWQLMTTYYVNDFDKFVINNVCPYYSRYADDIILIVPEEQKSYVLNQFPAMRSELAKVKIRFKENKFYCQSYYHGFEYLGFHIIKNQVHLNERIVNKAYKLLNSKCGLDKFIHRVNSYLGLMKLSTDTDDIIRYLDSITRNVKKDYINLKIC